jgi:hypothetical protein
LVVRRKSSAKHALIAAPGENDYLEITLHLTSKALIRDGRA